MNAQYRIAPGANVDRTGRVGQVVITPAKLVQQFGAPGAGEGYKVSGEFRFTDGGNDVFTVYDWKATSLYYEDDADRQSNGRPKPADFWSSQVPCTLNIGGRRGTAKIEQFKRWLLAVVESA